MAKVQLGNVVVLDNPSPFLNPFQFELTFECIEELKEGKFGRRGYSLFNAVYKVVKARNKDRRPSFFVGVYQNFK